MGESARNYWEEGTSKMFYLKINVTQVEEDLTETYNSHTNGISLIRNDWDTLQRGSTIRLFVPKDYFNSTVSSIVFLVEFK